MVAISGTFEKWVTLSQGACEFAGGRMEVHDHCVFLQVLSLQGLPKGGFVFLRLSSIWKSRWANRMENAYMPHAGALLEDT